jgi:hypothetical protein
MTNYHHDEERQPTFIHFDSQLGEPQGRISRASRVSRQSHTSTSAQTWLYTSQQPTREPPTIIIPVATADLPTRQPAEYGVIDDEEYMNIDPDGPDLETAMAMGSPNLASPTFSRSGGRGFVGGFISRLRKTLMRGHSQKRKPLRRDATDAGNIDFTEGSELPAYEPAGPADISNVEYVQASEMPVPEPAVPIRSLSRSTLMGPRPLVGTQPSRSHSRAPTATRESRESETHPVHHTPTPSQVLNAIVGSPVQPEPLRSPEYTKAAPGVRVSSDPSATSRTFRFDKFLRDLKSLPWISTRITVDYIPGEGTLSKNYKTLKPSASWYTHPNHTLDILSSSASDSYRSPYSYRSHARNSSPTLSSPNTSIPNGRSTRYRSFRLGSHEAPRHGHPMYPYGFPPYGYNYSPQPLFVMQPQSQVNSPGASQPGMQPAPFPDISQAVPVYMVPPTVGSPVPSRVRSHRSNRSARHPEIHPYPLSVPGHPVPPTS